jgi:hypothetical protein
MFPTTTGTWEVGHLPEPVQSIWNEAISVFGVGAHSSAVVACGRTLEQAAIERNIKQGTLQNRIEKMQADGLITTEFKGAMDYVRLIRNVEPMPGKKSVKRARRAQCASRNRLCACCSRFQASWVV